MTKAEIRAADESTLQERMITLMADTKTYEPGKSDQNREYLMIGQRLALMRGQTDEAIVYSEELLNRYGETLR